MSSTAVIRCHTYDDPELSEKVRTAVAHVLDIRPLVTTGTRVLLKPNILYGSPPERAVTTHPRLVWVVGSLFRELGAEIWIGDSSGFGSTARNMRASGLLEVASALDARIIPFTDPVDVHVPDGRVSRHFTIERAVMEADMLVNLPKLKTHALMTYTGAVKNLYGCIPGLEKGKGHMRMPDRELFAEMLVDLNTVIRPQLNIMDAIVGMEGQGPGSGDPRHVGLVLASTSTFALDAVASSVIGLEVGQVPYLRKAADRGIAEADPKQVTILGECLDAVRVPDFRQVPAAEGSRRLRNRMLAILGKMSRNLILDRPVVVAEKCRRCGVCVKVCPVSAMHMTDKGLHLDGRTCIRCYCCQELCPYQAIETRKTLFG